MLFCHTVLAGLVANERLPVVPKSALGAVLPIATLARPTTGLFRVLVVDDNVDMAESLAMLVLAAGHDVQTVHDGATALTVALDYRPNAVLLDIGLPGQHGYEVARQLRQQPGQEKVLLIAAFASRAELLLLDEPTTGLDPLMEQVFRDCVREARCLRPRPRRRRPAGEPTIPEWTYPVG